MIVRIDCLRSGQAMMELAIGMLLIVLLVSSSVVFAQYIVKSLTIQNHMRSSSRVVSDKVKLTAYEQDEIFGMKVLKINEPAGDVNHTIY